MWPREDGDLGSGGGGLPVRSKNLLWGGACYPLWGGACYPRAIGEGGFPFSPCAGTAGIGARGDVATVVARVDACSLDLALYYLNSLNRGWVFLALGTREWNRHKFTHRHSRGSGRLSRPAVTRSTPPYGALSARASHFWSTGGDDFRKSFQFEYVCWSINVSTTP